MFINLQNRIRRAPLSLLIIVAMIIISYQEVKAVAITFPKQVIELDYGATLTLAEGKYYDMSNQEGMEYPTNRPITVQLPEGFRLASLKINGRPHGLEGNGQLKPLDVPQWHNDGRVLNIEAKIVPKEITSAKMLAAILNTYQPGAVNFIGNKVILNTFVSIPEADDIVFSNRDLDIELNLNGYCLNSKVVRLNEGSLIISGSGYAFNSLFVSGGELRLLNDTYVGDVVAKSGSIYVDDVLYEEEQTSLFRMSSLTIEGDVSVRGKNRVSKPSYYSPRRYLCTNLVINEGNNIIFENVALAYIKVTVMGGNTEFYNIHVDNNYASNSGDGVCLIQYGGIINVLGDSYLSRNYKNAIRVEAGSLNIKGGHISGNGSYSEAPFLYLSGSNSVVNISGGTSRHFSIYSKDANLNITDGNFYAPLIHIEGGNLRGTERSV